MLGRLRMSVDDALKRYDSLVEEVFRDGKKRMGDGKLEDVFKKIIRDAKGDAELRMMDSSSDEHVCKTYVAVSPLLMFGI
jgi:hypothetical protein